MVPFLDKHYIHIYIYPSFALLFNLHFLRFLHSVIHPTVPLSNQNDSN